ncbi:MAG: amino acid adenylation domain-containing protein, partial [Blastocatellia bacterium]|nr:amino acid adenylation domain-containing protein [Blastocatellia bacterium]
VLNLPTDRPRPLIQTHNGSSYASKIEAQLTQKLKIIANTRKTTLYTVLLSIFEILLFRYSGQEDIIIGSPMAGRTQEEFTGTIGYFINPVPLRANFSNNPIYQDFLLQTREVVLSALENQDFPTALIADRLHLNWNAGRPPLFQTMFILQQPHRLVETAPFVLGEAGAHMKIGELLVESYPLEQRATPFDILLMAVEHNGELLTSWQYNSDLFDKSTIIKMAKHFSVLLESIILNPLEHISFLSLLTEVEKQEILLKYSGAEKQASTGCLHTLFEQQVLKTPQAIAIIFENKPLTYNELNLRANQLAHYLIKLEVSPETLVGISIERSFEMIISLLAVLKAGGAYLPLDPNYPKDRVSFMVQDAQIKIILTKQNLTSILPKQVKLICLDSDLTLISKESEENPNLSILPTNLAYVIYTSGSTGNPKGILIEHFSVVNYITQAIKQFELTSSDQVLQFASINFDTSAEEIYPTLVSGATLVLRNDEMIVSVANFLEKCLQWNISVLDLPTAFWHEMVLAIKEENLLLPSTLRLVIIGGEKALAERLVDWQQYCKIRLLNTYGPTEATIAVSCCELNLTQSYKAQNLPIGYAIEGTKIYILDKYLQPLPTGVVGELFIGGNSLSRGYLANPELTAEKFIQNPLEPGSRLYRTGDLARFLTDGNIEYIGRNDNQVKIRGYRVELGEIESAILKYPTVRETVVVTKQDKTLRLIAYVVTATEKKPLASELQNFLKEILPDYMIPTAFIYLDSLPLTPNHKIDYRALPTIDFYNLELEGDYLAPRTVTEELVAGIWIELLNIKQVSINKSFFELGGHSLLATQLISRLRSNFAVELPLRSLFEAPTIANLAARIDEANQTKQNIKIPSISPVPRNVNLPLSFSQERLWFLEQLELETPHYNIPLALKIQGNLNIKALEISLNALIKRHEALRTSINVINGIPHQLILENNVLTINEVDLTSLSIKEQEEKQAELLLNESRYCFNLSVLPLLRITLVQLNHQEYVLLIVMHHIISDAWSVGIFIKEMLVLYKNYSQSKEQILEILPKLPIQYADYAYWQRQWMQGEVFEKQ